MGSDSDLFTQGFIVKKRSLKTIFVLSFTILLSFYFIFISQDSQEKIKTVPFSSPGVSTCATLPASPDEHISTNIAPHRLSNQPLFKTSHDSNGAFLAQFTLPNFTIDTISDGPDPISKLTFAENQQVTYLDQEELPKVPVFSTNLAINDSAIMITPGPSRFIPAPPPEVSSGLQLRPQQSTQTVESQLEGIQPSSAFSKSAPFTVRHQVGQLVRLFPVRYDYLRQGYLITDQYTIEVQDSPVAQDALSSMLFDNQSSTSSTTVPETRLLLIVPPSLETTISNFQRWKKQLGYEVYVAHPPTLDAAFQTNLKSEITNQFLAHDITHVILFGDEDLIPPTDQNVTYYNKAIPSDTYYAMVSGSDFYEDLIIARIPISNPVDLSNYLDKAISYEQNLVTTGHWYQHALWIAGHDGRSYIDGVGKYDHQLLDEEDTKLKAAGLLTSSTKVYDQPDHLPQPTTGEILDGLTSGTAITYYLGHGLETGWVRPQESWDFYFHKTDLPAIETTTPFAPFYYLGNCRNGDFTYKVYQPELFRKVAEDCLTESLLKEGDGSSPAGAIGALSATTDMYWNPPIAILRDFNDQMLQNPYHTAGEWSLAAKITGVNWTQQVAEDPTAAAVTAYQLHYFGDPTLRLRIKAPQVFSLDTLLNNEKTSRLITLGQPMTKQPANQLIVSDPYGTPVDAYATAFDLATDTTTTQAVIDGHFSVNQLPLTNSLVTFTKPGFIPFQTPIQLHTAPYTQLQSNLDLSVLFGAGTYQLVSAPTGITLVGSTLSISDDLLTGGSGLWIEFNLNGTSHHLRLMPDPRQEGEFTFSIQAGWNLLGLPVQSELNFEQLMRTSNESLIQLPNQCWGWNEQAIYTNLSTDLIPNAGDSFWFYQPKEAPLTQTRGFDGTPLRSSPNLSNGWNLFTPTQITSPTFNNFEIIWDWNEENQCYNELAEDSLLLPTQAYWIYHYN